MPRGALSGSASAGRRLRRELSLAERHALRGIRRRAVRSQAHVVVIYDGARIWRARPRRIGVHPGLVRALLLIAAGVVDGYSGPHTAAGALSIIGLAGGVLGVLLLSCMRRVALGESLSEEDCVRQLERLVGGDEPRLDTATLTTAIAALRNDPTALCGWALASELVNRAIDYRHLGLGWDHPHTRTEYQENDHPSQRNSRARQSTSIDRLADELRAIGAGEDPDPRARLTRFVVLEIGIEADHPIAAAATFDGVVKLLYHELLDPLRALHEGRASMERTFNGEPLPPDAINDAVNELLIAVVSGAYRRWRYTNPAGKEQLRGLGDAREALWQECTVDTNHTGGLKTIEGDETELSFFWATKIGGPSHGFDFEAQCLLPLVCNARHKVILVDGSGWSHPAARAHFRLLWTQANDEASAQEPQPLLWLESTHFDFRASDARDKTGARGRLLDQTAHHEAVLRHAVRKAVALGARLSADVREKRNLKNILAREELPGTVTVERMKVILRPSNGVVEASDYLSLRHDWDQRLEEVLTPGERVIFSPTHEAAPSSAQAQGAPDAHEDL